MSQYTTEIYSFGYINVQSLRGNMSKKYDGGLPTETAFELQQKGTNVISQHDQL